MVTVPVQILKDEIADFCVRNDLRKLSLFGSVPTPRFNDESDVDMLVEFEPGLGPECSVSFEWNGSFRKWLGERSISGRRGI